MHCKFHHVLQQIYQLGNHVHDMLLDYAEALIATHSRRKAERHLELVALTSGSETGAYPASTPVDVPSPVLRPILRGGRRTNWVGRFAQVIIFFFLVVGLFQVYRFAIEGGRSDAINLEESIRRDVAAYKLLGKLIDHEKDILGKIAARNDGPAVAQYITLNEALNEDLKRVTGLRGRIASKKRELQRSL